MAPTCGLRLAMLNAALWRPSSPTIQHSMAVVISGGGCRAAVCRLKDLDGKQWGLMENRNKLWWEGIKKRH